MSMGEFRVAPDDPPPLSSRVTAGGRALPDWAIWLVELGSWLRARSDEPMAPVIAISVPTRRLAAVLVAAGAHDAGVRLFAPVSVGQALELIAGWGEGANVAFDFRGNRREGSIVTVTDQHIEIESAGDICGVPHDRVLAIDLLPDGSLPSRRPRRLPASATLRSHLYPRDPLNQIGSSRVECLLIGPKGQIELELAVTIELRSGQASDLNSVIRPSSLLPPKSPFRTEVVAAGAEGLPTALQARPPKTVVLDGAGATLDWLHRAPDVPILVVLDRTEARAEAAAAVVLGHRASAARLRELRDLDPVPPAVEIVGYDGHEVA